MTQKNIDEIIREYYNSKYSNIHTKRLLGKANKKFHVKLEKKVGQRDFPRTLELGVGNFEHLPYVKGNTIYFGLDLRPLDFAAFQKVTRQDSKKSIHYVQSDATLLPFADESFDRVIVTCVLMHLNDPINALIEWQRVCREYGEIHFLVPCDPGILMRLFRFFVSEKSARRYDVNADTYRLINAAEHVSSFPRLDILIKNSLVGEKILVREFYPFNFLKSWNLNAFCVYRIIPKNLNSKSNIVK